MFQVLFSLVCHYGWQYRITSLHSAPEACWSASWLVEPSSLGAHISLQITSLATALIRDAPVSLSSCQPTFASKMTAFEIWTSTGEAGRSPVAFLVLQIPILCVCKRVEQSNIIDSASAAKNLWKKHPYMWTDVWHWFLLQICTLHPYSLYCYRYIIDWLIRIIGWCEMPLLNTFVWFFIDMWYTCGFIFDVTSIFPL